MEVKTVFGTEKFQVEVCGHRSTIEGEDGKRKAFNGLSLVLSRNGKIAIEDKQPMYVTLTKEDAKQLAIQLLKMASEPVAQHGGLSLDNYQEWGVTLYHAIEDSGKLCNEPLICIDGLIADEVPEDGSITLSLTNESAKELISGLATIV